MARILLVEDDAPIAELVAVHLKRAGHEVCIAADGENALTLHSEREPELILLDVMLPQIGGVEVCTTIRQRGGPQPIIVMLTARRDEADALRGFEAGADDYVRKPFSLAELIRRVDALLALARRPVGPVDRSSALPAPSAQGTGRRGQNDHADHADHDDDPANCAALHVDALAQRVRVRGRAVHLTPKEFALLSYLVSRPDQVIPREALLAEIWQYNHAGYARTVDTHVMRVRRKLSRGGLEGDPIRTVFGVGYRFEGDPH